MFENLTLYYDPAERRSFCRPDGLWRAWASRYPNLFDRLDVREMETFAPRGRGYHEWLAAIGLYRLTGYNCLLGKYQLKGAHPKKFEIFGRLVPEEVRALLPVLGRPQGPDLLMYAPSMDDWFFAEAKGPREGLTRSQKLLFPRLEEASAKKIRFVRICPRRRATA